MTILKYKVTDEVLEDFFIDNFHLIENFSTLVETKTTGREIRILAFNNKSDNETITEALVILRKKLRDSFFKEKSIPFSLLQKSIINALILHKHHSEDRISTVLNFAESCTRKYINAPYIKKSLPHLNLDSKQIVKILLDSGKWDYKLRENSGQKQFFKKIGD
jgi:hypothetical protein